MWSFLLTLALLGNSNLTVDRFAPFSRALFPRPHVISVFPPEGAQNVFPYTPIFLRWDQPVTEDSVFAHLRIEPDLMMSSKRTLHLYWDHERFPGFFAITLVPYLPPDQEITLSIAPGVQSRQSEQKSDTIFTVSFTTTPLPKSLWKSFGEKIQ